jgi:hypothetical protein
MNHPFFIISLLLVAVNSFSGTSAWAAAILKTIDRNDEAGRIQIFLHFDQLPGYNLTTSGRKIEIAFADTETGGSLTPLETDAKMIKMVSQVEHNTTTLFFYFRYPPQKVTAESNKNTAVLMLDILLGNQLSVSHPELSSKLQGVSVVKRIQSDTLNPVNQSVFTKNWRQFFTQYESPLNITPTPKLHLPPFPLAALLPPQTTLDQWLSKETLTLIKDEKWPQSCQVLKEQIVSQPDERLKERLVLAYAEALVRAGEYRSPHFLLQRIIVEYPDSLMANLANYLLIYLQAERGDYTNAYYELLGLQKKIDLPSLTGHCNLLLAELAMMSGLNNQAATLLDDQTVGQDASLQSIRQLRQADLLSVSNQKVKALTGYLALVGKTPLIDTDPMSLARFADALYSDQRFAEAAKRYQQLGDLLANQPGLDLVLFRLAMCRLHIPGSEKRVKIDLQQLQNAFPNSQGGVRAQFKQTDLEYITNKMAAREAEQIYGKFAVEAESILLREEAAFKQALVNTLAGEGEASVNQCMELLRGFQSGNLRTEATALLIQQLPGVIKQLVKNGEYIKALVLAKQNKTLFARGWLDTSLLYDLARAYNKLGMTDQTAQTYRYLFEVTSDSNKEQIYLPLIQALSASGHLLQVEEYADRYQLRFPQGKDLAAVLALKIQALYASGQLDKTLSLLTSGSNPKALELELLKGRIYFEKKEWQKVVDTLAQPNMLETLSKHAMLLPLAESYFQLGKDEQALALFQRIKDHSNSSEQVQFRLAQLALKKENKPDALILFKELAEKGKDPLWTKMAREEVAILEMENR